MDDATICAALAFYSMSYHMSFTSEYIYNRRLHGISFCIYRKAQKFFNIKICM